MKARPVPIADLTLDVMAQPRVTTKDVVASEYAERMQAGDEFPPAVTFSDGRTIWLADGWHRYAAAVGTGASTLLCEVNEGGLRDAILYACGANDTHGLKRTNEDKRKAVKTLLDDEEWQQWSDREIARVCRVNHELVGSLRPQPAMPLTGGNASEDEDDDEAAEPEPRKRRYRTKHGTLAEMDTAEIGKREKEAAAFKEEVERTAFVSRAVIDLLEATKKLPPPEDVAALFRWPDQYTPEDFDTVVEWFSAFSKALRKRGNVHARAA